MTTVRQFVTQVAFDFMRANGNEFTIHSPETPSAAFDARMSQVAEWYMTTPHSENTIIPWLTLADNINHQFAILSERIEFVWVSFDPISNVEELYGCVDAGVLPVWNSCHTGGHPLWHNEINNRFRAVHDVMGHYLNRIGFDKYGEDATYRAHRATMPRSAWRALATETRGQNAALNYGNPIGEFKEQKCIFAPDWVIA